MDEFLSHKQLTLLKVITNANDIVKIYCAQDVAILFEFKGKFYPTLFMVWTFYNIVPRLKLDKSVKSKIKSSPELTIKDLNSINNDNLLCALPADQCVSLCINSCQKMIAVGYLMVDGNTIKINEKSDEKCLKILHYHEDELFKSHILKIIPDIISVMEREFNNALEINDDIPNQLENTQSTIVKMDEVLMICSLKTLKHSITKEMLPILASTFYKKYVMSVCPEGVELDIKKTSFKKLSVFLQLLEEEGIIKLNVGSNGIVEITRIIHSNSKFQEIEENPNLEENVNQHSPPVKEIYIVTPGLYPIFSEFLCRFVDFIIYFNIFFYSTTYIYFIIVFFIYSKGDELPIPSIRRYVTEYIKKYELQDSTNPSYVSN